MPKFLNTSDYLPDPQDSALLVVDVQERLSAAMPAEEMAQVTRNIVILMEAAREFGIPTVVSEQYPKGLGPTVTEIRAALDAGTEPVQKMAFSCCAESAFQPIFADWQDRAVILAGIESHVCVLQTALDLLGRGRRVFIPADATCSRSLHNRQLALDMLSKAGAVVGSTEIFVFGMQRVAGTERFKRISKLVK